MIQLLSLSLLFACGAEEKAEPGTDRTDPTQEEELWDEDSGLWVFLPTTGNWHLNDIEYSENTCGVEQSEPIGEDSGGTWALQMDENGMFTVWVAPYLSLFSCAVEEKSLVCNQMTFENDLTPAGSNAVLGQTFNLAIEFTDVVNGSAVWSMDQSCSGDDCDGLTCVVQGAGTLKWHNPMHQDDHSE